MYTPTHIQVHGHMHTHTNAHPDTHICACVPRHPSTPPDTHMALGCGPGCPYLPAFILFELVFFPLLARVGQELVHGDHEVLVLVNLPKHVLTHSVHLLVSLHGVILIRRIAGIINFVQLKMETETLGHDSWQSHCGGCQGPTRPVTKG